MNETTTRSICALCVATADATRSEQPFLHNQKLFETRRFVVLPSLGPLVPGHVMVVSKAHYHSLASMGAEAVTEYESLAARLTKAPFLADGHPLEAEHGSTPSDKAGACVIHTHVHWLPGMGRFWNEFADRLSLRAETSLLDFGCRDVPYIFARARTQQGIFHAEGLRSQTIRRILCELMDRDDTDWMQAPRLNWVQETVDAWLRSDKNL
jgi:diadenosine tetraphosphate (Ap4A) HIT family hydrolase